MYTVQGKPMRAKTDEVKKDVPGSRGPHRPSHTRALPPGNKMEPHDCRQQGSMPHPKSGVGADNGSTHKKAVENKMEASRAAVVW